MTEAEAAKAAYARFGATRTDYRENAEQDATGGDARCRLFRNGRCIGGGATWEAAMAHAAGRYEP